jgi:hypothetical protein
MLSFKAGRVATDVAARGLDISTVTQAAAIDVEAVRNAKVLEHFDSCRSPPTTPTASPRRSTASASAAGASAPSPRRSEHDATSTIGQGRA